MLSWDAGVAYTIHIHISRWILQWTISKRQHQLGEWCKTRLGNYIVSDSSLKTWDYDCIIYRELDPYISIIHCGMGNHHHGHCGPTFVIWWFGDDDDDDDDDVNIMHHLGQRCMLTIVSALQIQNLSRLGLNSWSICRLVLNTNWNDFLDQKRQSTVDFWCRTHEIFSWERVLIFGQW